MTRLLLVALTTTFVFCGCQSAPTFGQSATSAPQPQSEGLLDSVVQGVSSLLSGTSSAGSISAKPDKPGVTLVDVATGVDGLVAQLKDMQVRLDAVESRTSKIDRRGGQSRLLVLGLLGLNGAVALVLLLVALGVIGRPPLLSDVEKAKLVGLRRIAKRQAELAAAIGELQSFAVQANVDREQFSMLLNAAADELKKLEATTGAVAETVHV